MNTLTWIIDGSFSTKLTLALLHFLWQGCAGGVIVMVGGWLLRDAAARSRYVLNVATMLVMAACLPVTFLLLETPDPIADRADSVQSDQAAMMPVAHVERPDSATIPALPDGPAAVGVDESAVELGPDTGTDMKPGEPDRVSNTKTSVGWQSLSSTLTANAFPALSRWVAVLYLTGVALILGRLLRGVWGGDRLRKLATPIKETELLQMVSQLAQRLGLRVVPTIAWCEQISIPVVVGIVTPMILLPMAVASGLTPSQLQALMLHELSHIRRFDPVVNLLQRVVEAALFFHPLVWFVSRRISIERELAADDMVLAAGWDRPLYADALVRVAELASAITGPDIARRATVLSASGTNPSEFKARVLRLLGESPPPKLNMTRVGIAVTLLLLVAGGTFAWSQIDKSESTPDRQNPADVVEDEPVVLPAEQSIPKELEPFQGVWGMVICDSEDKTLYAPQEVVRHWRWTIKGNEILWQRESQVWKLTFKVDPAKSPKEIDLTYLDGPLKGVTCLGMYEWSGVDRKCLQISIQDPGATVERPKSISMTGGGQTSLIFLNPIDHEYAVSQFQGTWSVKVQSDTWLRPFGKENERRWMVKGNEITWTSLDGDEVKASFTIDSAKSPQEIDLTFLSGPDKGKKCLGIYDQVKLGKKPLQLCLAEPGSEAARPTEFQYEPKAGRVLIGLDPIDLSVPQSSSDVKPRVEPAVAPTAQSIAREKELFQRAWKFNTCWSESWRAETDEVRKWRWTVKGDQIVWAGPGSEEWKLSFTIDPSKSPKEIDLTFLDGPHQGERCAGIYTTEGEGQEMWLCLQDPGAKTERPIEFPGGLAEIKNSGRSLIILEPVVPNSVETELASLQGSWLLSNLQTQGWPKPIGKGPDPTGQGSKWEWLIEGTEIIWTSPENEEIRLSFTIDPAKSPKCFDVTFLSGPDKGKKCLGLYERGGMLGKSLWLCLTDPDSKAARPADLSFSTYQGRSLMILQPIRPTPKEIVGIAVPPDGLEFLKPYPKLQGLSLDMTEPQLLEIVKQAELKTRKTVAGEKIQHYIALGDGHTLIVMFDQDAKCSGIQRVRGDETPDDTTTLRKPVLLLPDHWILESVGFDKDGTELVTASIQSFVTIRRWDLVGKKLISEIKLEGDTHGRFLRDETMMLSADRRKVIAATDAYVGIWETATGKLLRKLPIPKVGNDDTIRKLTCTPDFSLVVGHLATEYYRTTLRYDAHTVVWDGTSDKMLRILTHQDETNIIAISLSADGKRLATTNGSGARIWDPGTGQLLLTVKNDNSGRTHSDPEVSSQYTNNVWSIQFSPDGKLLAMGDILGVKLVDATSGEVQRQLEGPYRYSSGHGGPNLVFSKDGQMLARLGTGSKTDYVVPIWSTQTGQTLFEIYTNANDAAFSDDGRRLAVGFSDLQQALTVWKLDRGGSDPEQTEGPGPEPRQDKVDENGHYQGAKAAEFIEAFKPTWSDPKLGIQYGIAFTRPQHQFKVGERVPVVAFFRNASDKPLKMDTRPDYFGNTPKVTDANGAAIQLENIPLVGRIAHYVQTLKPGEAVGPFYFNFGLGENPRPGRQYWHPYYKNPALGAYKLTHTVSVNVGGPNNGDQATETKITSSQIEFEIVGGKPEEMGLLQPSRPAPADSKSKPDDEPAPVPDTKIAKELEPFQGVWPMSLCDSDNDVLGAPLEEVRRTWRWEIQGNKIAWTRSGEEVWHLTFSVDPTQRPKEIDLTYLDGPFKGTTSLGVYEWGGKNNAHFNISVQNPGAKPARPKDMSWVGGGQTTLILLNPPVPPPSAEKEVAALQGVWRLSVLQTDAWPRPIGKGNDRNGKESEWKWLIQGNEISWTSPAGEEIKLSFTLDPLKTPKHFDVTFLSGPDKDQKCLGIYQRGGLGDDKLYLCLTDPGSNKPRPTNFTYDGFQGRSAMLFDPIKTTASPEVSQPNSKPSVVPGTTSSKESLAKELEPFQGYWAIESLESAAATIKISYPQQAWRWSIKGSEVVWGREGQQFKLVAKLDPSATPKQIDFTFLDGPNKGEACPGIYEWSGDDGMTLRIRMQDPGAKIERPTTFEMKKGSQTSLIVLRSIPPVDPVKELASFQGTWCFDILQIADWPQPIGIGTDSDGRASEKRMVVKGNQISWTNRQGEQVAAEFTIDPFKTPKQIDFTFIQGPQKGRKSIGIYEPQMGNDNYRWLCMTHPGSDAPRPIDVSASSFKQQSMIGMHQVAPPEKPSAAKSLERFQGLWNVTLCDSVLKTYGATQQEASKWQWTIKGDEVLWSRQGEVWKLKLAVDPSKRPREIDLTYLTGPFQGEKCLGMYEFGGIDEQSLRIAIQDPGAKVPRPQAIEMSSSSQTGFIFLRPNQPSDSERQIGQFQGTWTLRNYDTGRNGDKSSWPIPKGKGPDKLGHGSELRWVVKGTEITWTNKSGEEIKASFTIDPRKRPKQIDLTFLTGPDKGETCPGIYQRGDLDENILWLCMADPGSKGARPKEFAYQWGEGRSVLSLYPFDSSTAPKSAVVQPKPTPADLAPEKREAIVETVAETFLRFGDARSIGTNADTEYARLTDKGEEPARRTDLKEGVHVRYEFVSATKGATKVVILPTRQNVDPKSEVPKQAPKGEVKQDAPPANATSKPSNEPASVPVEKPVPKELEPFQGIWPMDICDSVNRRLYAPQKEVNTWRWAIKGNEIVWSRSGGEVWHLTFKVDPTKSPKEIDLTYLDGPFKGQTCLGMYEWGGINKNMLQMSLQDPGAKVSRPTSISMTGTGETSLIFLNPRTATAPAADVSPNSKPAGEPLPKPPEKPATNPGVKDQPAAKGVMLFEGVWDVEQYGSLRWPAETEEAQTWRWTIRGQEVTWTRPGKETIKLSIAVDPEFTWKSSVLRNPIEVTVLDSAGSTWKRPGIFYGEGDTIWICFQDPGAGGDRPKTMGFNGYDRQTLVRLKPAPLGSESPESGKNPVPSAKENPTLEKGLQVFQGTWKFDACESILWYIKPGTTLKEIRESWKWAIEGREMTWTRAGKEPVRMTIKVDPTKQPNQIDFTFLDGPDKGKTCQGIYEFERMNLWICMTEPGANVPRPEKMGMSSESKTALIILQHARKNRIAAVEKVDKAAPKPAPAAMDSASLLQGTFNLERWTSEKWPAKPDELSKWQWKFQGHEVAWTRPGQETVRLSFAVDASKPLPEIDLIFLDGPDKGEKCRGVYLASRHEVVLCFQDPGANVDRPKDWVSKPGNHHTAMKLVPVRVPPVAEEIAALGGDWKFDIYYSDWWPARISNPPLSWEPWRWSINENEIAWTGMKIDDVRLSYTLDPSKSPKQIDLTFLDGPYKGKKLRGIYKFGFGNSCDICVADPDGNADRPISFGFGTNSGNTWISLNKSTLK